VGACEAPIEFFPAKETTQPMKSLSSDTERRKRQRTTTATSAAETARKRHRFRFTHARAHPDGLDALLSKSVYHSERSESERGPSHARLAEALTREVLKAIPALRTKEYRVYSITRTVRFGDLAALTKAALEYCAIFERRVRDGGLLLALDIPAREHDDPDLPPGHWHLHGIAIVRNKSSRKDERPLRQIGEEKLKRWWIRLTDAELVAQDSRRLNPHRIDQELQRVLLHCLDRGRWGEDAPVIRLCDRVFAAGSLRGLWQAVGHRLGVAGLPPGPEADTAQPARKKASTFACQLPRRGPRHCRWCGKELKGRSDIAACSGHRQPISRALVNAERKHGEQLRALVTEFERERWLVRDAIRLAVAQLRSPEISAVRKECLRCTCGKPLARHLRAKSCGRALCRLQVHRKRVKEQTLDRALAVSGHEEITRAIELLRGDVPGWRGRVAVRLARGVLDPASRRIPPIPSSDARLFVEAIGRTALPFRKPASVAKLIGLRASKRLIYELVADLILDGFLEVEPEWCLLANATPTITS
jgi:hypothetical protein